MLNNILYYPSIKFQKEDWQWLWASSLLWDKIYRIVPEGFDSQYENKIIELCSENEIGIPISPNNYIEETAKEFMDKLNCAQWNAKTLDMNRIYNKSYDKYSYVHKDKVDVSIRNTLLLDKKMYEGEEWLKIPYYMANLYMTFLANNIAKRNNLSLFASNKDFFTASTYFLHDGQLNLNYMQRDFNFSKNDQVLGSMIIDKIFPENILSIQPKKILEFRRKRSDERKYLMDTLNELIDEISKVEDKKIINDIINIERKKIDEAISNYKKSMDIIKVKKWTGVLTSAITYAGSILPNGNAALSMLGILSASYILFCSIANLSNSSIQNNINRNPYTYLAEIQTLDNKYWYSRRLYDNFFDFIND